MRLLRFNEMNAVEYSIEHRHPENILVLSRSSGKTIGNLEIIDESHMYDEGDEDICFDIVTAAVDESHRRKGIYLGMIRHFLEENRYGVTSLRSQKWPDFDEGHSRSDDADRFWESLYVRQKQLGLNIEREGDDEYGWDYTISRFQK
jgi:hypothetical protein